MLNIKKCTFAAKKNLKYPANHFIEDDENILRSLIEIFPLATLVSVDKDNIHTSYLPFILDSSKDLIGHLDANNPQVSLLQNEKKVRLIFNGPEAYISPSHFLTNELPTYNYFKIEVDGIVKPIPDEDLKLAIIQLTTQLEGDEAAYKLTHDEKRLHSLVNYIYGFKVEVKQICGRFKMSQDKSKAHQQTALNLIQDNIATRSKCFMETYRKQA